MLPLSAIPPAPETEDDEPTYLSDLGYSLQQGGMGLPDALAGIIDIALPFDPASKALQAVEDYAGYDLATEAQKLDALKRPETREFNRALEGKGFLDTVGAYAENPSQLGNLIARTAPDMLAGGVLGKGARALGLAKTGLGAGAIGEGAISAGHQMSATDSELASLVTGAGTGLVAFGGGTLAQKMGLHAGDIESLVAGGASSETVEKVLRGEVADGLLGKAQSTLGKSLTARMGASAVMEGAEELLQAPFETIPANIVQGREWDEDLGRGMAEGLLAGSVMGAGTSLVDPARKTVKGEIKQEKDDAAFRRKQEVADAKKDFTTKYFMDLRKRVEEAEEGSKAQTLALEEFNLIKDLGTERAKVNLENPMLHQDEWNAALNELSAIVGIGPKKLSRIKNELSYSTNIEELEAKLDSVTGLNKKDRANILSNDALMQSLKNNEALAFINDTTNSEKQLTEESIKAANARNEAKSLRSRYLAEAEKSIIKVPEIKTEATVAKETDSESTVDEQPPEKPSEQEIDTAELRDKNPDATDEELQANLKDLEAMLDEAGVNDAVEPATQKQVKPAKNEKNTTVPAAMRVFENEDTSTVKLTGEAYAKKVKQQDGAMAALISLINGVTPNSVKEMLGKIRKSRYKNVKDAKRDKKELASEIFTAKGKFRKNFRGQAMPADIRKFFDTLNKYGRTTDMTARARGQLRRRANELAGKYNYPELGLAASRIVAGFGSIDRAKIPAGEQNMVEAIYQQLENKPATEDLVAKFDELRGLLNRYDTIKSRFGNVDPMGRSATKGRIPEDLKVDLLEALKKQADGGVLNKDQEELVRRYGFNIEVDLEDIAEQFELPIDLETNERSNKSALNWVTENINELFAEIELLVGRDALNAAMFGSKAFAAMSKKDPLWTAAAGQESKTGVRFSQLYKQYKQSNAVEPGRIPANEIRKLNETQERLRNPEGSITFESGKDNVRTHPKAGTTQIQDKIIEAQKEAEESHKNISPVEALLGALTPQMYPAVQVLRENLYRILNQLASRSAEARLGSVFQEDGVTTAPFIDNIRLTISAEKGVNGNGSTVVGHTSLDDDGKIHITLYKGGDNVETILHEVLHATTLGILNSARTGNVLTTNQKRIVKDIERLAKHAVTTFNKMSDSQKAALKINNKTAHGIISEVIDNGDGTANLDEFVAYSMTSNKFQAFLKTVVAPKTKAVKGKNLWQAFKFKMATLFGLGNKIMVRNKEYDNMFDDVMEANSALLAEIYAESNKGNDIFSIRGVPKPAVSLDSKTFNDTQGDSDYTQSMHEKAVIDAMNNGTLSGKEAYEESIREKKRIETGKSLAYQEKNITVVKNRKNKKTWGKRRSAWLPDRVLESIFDAVTRAISTAFFDGKYTTFSQFAEDAVYNAAGTKVVSFTEKNTPMAKMVGYIFSNWFSGFGTPDSFKNSIRAVSAQRQGIMNVAHASYDELVTMNEAQQQMVLDNLDNAKFEEVIRKQLPKKYQQPVVDLIASVRHMYDVAVGTGQIKTTSEGFPPIRELFAIGKTGQFKFIRGTNIDTFSPVSDKKSSRDSDVHLETVNVNNILWPYQSGGKWHSKRDMQSKRFVVALGANNETIIIPAWAAKNKQLLKDNGWKVDENARPLKHIGKDKHDSDLHLFARQRTVSEQNRHLAEHENTKFSSNPITRATGLSGLTAFIQELGMAIDTRMNTQAMITENQEIENTEDKWIIDGVLKNDAAGNVDIPEELSDMIDKERTHTALISGKKSSKKEYRKLLRKARIPGSWVAIPDNPDMRTEFGDLAGKLVRGPVFAGIEDFKDVSPIVDNESYNAIIAAWKRNKTAYSPAAHINNITGNFVFLYMHDVPSENFITAAKAVIHVAYGKKPTAEEKALVAEMNAMGITLAQAKTADYDPQADSLFDDLLYKIQQGEGSEKSNLMKAITLFERASSTMIDLYSMQDNIARLAMYMTVLQDSAGKKGIPKSGDVGMKMKQEAAMEATRAFVDYNIHAPAVKTLRQTLLPFMAWPYRAAGIMSRIAITKPWKLMSTVGAVYTANAAFYAILGMDDDEQDKEWALLPDWHQSTLWGIPSIPNYIRMPWSDEEGNPIYYNLARVIPLADIETMSNSGLPQVVNPGGPLTIFFDLLANKQSLTHKPIHEETDTRYESTLKAIGYVANNMAPGWATKAYADADKYFTGEQGPSGSEPNPWIDVARNLGLGVFQINVPDAKVYKTWNIKAIKRKYATSISRLRREANRQRFPNLEKLSAEIRDLNRRMIEELREELDIQEN
jgi:hypothetical protein